MSEWRVFFHPGATRFDTAIGSVIALESRSVPTEGDARKLLQELADGGRNGLSLSRPGTTKVLKGRELSKWLAQAEG
jgi:hypothetical protein